MARNIEVNLLFQANTSQAVNNINQLGQLLNKISTNTTIGVDSGSIQKAVTSARELQIQLEKAVNVETGKLNLSVLNKNLKDSGQSLNTLAANLQGVGTIGQQAFIKLANAVSQAEVPMIRVNQRLKNFGTTLLNTVKWQLASNAIHAVSGMLSSAVSHAERLNTALNDIRIVTGYNVNTMAEFADQASRAAKQLGTTTEEYAKASLIFYQQGLNGKDVTDRADVVTKLMKVTGQSAEVVSNQMTGIWNNFYDGSETLESFADKLTKLGAATASSTDEIAAGLEKFAAVADTVGLSYDYAAASVATVVAETRQSAEVVGTSFKTIFARLQDLKLGETLDDGTTLGLYSKNLAKVGVNIQDASGQLKDMDVILEETAAKWEMLDKGQQVALAKGVAGIKQYNQFIALMDNWDLVKDNIKMAENATGELTKQHDIWAQSYEGAAARVKQAQQNLYENFINDEDIVTLNNLFADLINGISNVVDSFGGLGPMVLTIVGLFSQTLFPLIINGFKNLGNVIGVWSGSAMSQVTSMQQQMSQQMTEILNNNNNLNESTRQQITLSQKLLEVKQQLTLASKSMTLEEKLQAESRMQVYESIHAQIAAILEKRAALETEIKAIKDSIDLETTRTGKRIIAANALINQEVSNGSDEEIINNQANKALSISEVKLKEELTEKQRAYDEAVKKGSKEQQEALNKEIQYLEKVLELKTKINANSSMNATKMVVGTSSGEMIDEEQTQNQKNYTAIMGQQMAQSMKDMKGSFDDQTGSLSSEASIQNLKKLYAVLGEYKTQLEQVKAVSKDFETAQKDLDNIMKNVSPEELSKGYEKITPAINQAKKAEIDYKKAKEEVAQAENKYGKNSKQVLAARSKMVVAAKQVQIAEKNVIKVQKQTSKAFQEVYKAQLPLLNSKNQIIDWANSMDATGAKARELDAAFENFINSGDIAELEVVKTFINDMGIASTNSVQGIMTMANSMQELLLAAGYSPEQIQPFINKLKELANLAPQVTSGMNSIELQNEKLKQSLNFTGEGFSKLLGSIGAFVGQTSMAASGFTSMISAFDDGNTPIQTMTSLLMGASMVLPILSGAFKKLKADKDKDTIATLKNLAATTAKAKADGVYTAQTWLLNAALAVKTILENKWVGLALVGLALGAAAAVAIYSKSVEEQNAQLEEENEQKIESAKKSKEQAEANTELLRSYNDLLATYKETGEGKEDLDEAAQKLAEAYNLEGAALARLTGEYADYKKVSDAAYEANKKELNNLLTEQESALKINVDKIVEAAFDIGNQTDEADGQFRVTLDGDADQSAVFKYFDQNSEFFKGIREDNDIDFKIDDYEANPEKFIEFYDYLNEAYNKMSKDKEAVKYDSYTDLKEIIVGLSDTVEEARANYDEVKKLKLTLGKTKATEGFNDELQNVDTISEYIDWVDRLEKCMTKAGHSQDEINDAIKMFTDETTNSAIKSLKYYKEFIDGVKKESGIGDEINDYFEGLSDEDKELFIDINFDIYKTKEEWDKQLEFLRNEVAIADLKVKVDTVTTTKGLIKETGMTEDDWIKVRDAGIEWGKDGIIEFNKFLTTIHKKEIKIY